ncbi:MAG: hypothetical protein ACYDD1_20365 [Caulobacteraceae bacterium]
MKMTIPSIVRFYAGERLLVQGMRRPAPYGSGPNFALLIGVAASAGFWCLMAHEITKIFH